MRDYGRLSSAMWMRGSGKRLRGNAPAQTLASYLVSCSHSNMLGLYHLTLGAVMHETGHDGPTIRQAFTDVEAAGFAFYDEDAELVWVPNVAQIELGDGLRHGDKRRKGIEKELRAVGRHRFVDEFLVRYGEAFGLETGANGPDREPPSKPLPAVVDAPSDTRGRGGTPPQDQAPDQAPDQAQAHSPFRASGPIGDFGTRVRRWEEGVRRGLGRGFSPTCRGMKADGFARDCLDAHFPKEGADPLAWFESEGEAFAKLADSAKYPLEIFGFLRWLNDGRPDKSRQSRTGKIVQEHQGDEADKPSWMKDTA